MEYQDASIALTTHLDEEHNKDALRYNPADANKWVMKRLGEEIF